MKLNASFVGLGRLGVGAAVALGVRLVCAAPTPAPTPADQGAGSAAVNSASSPAAAPAAPLQAQAEPANEANTQRLEDPWSEAAAASEENGQQAAPTSTTPPTKGSSAPIEKLVASQPDWGCEYEAHAITEKHVVVACKGGTLLTLVRTPTGVQLVGRRQVNGSVREFFEQEGSVWIRVQTETAESVIPGALLATGRAKSVPPVGAGLSAASAESVPEATLRGKVSRVNGRDVVVDVQGNHGLKEGDRLALSRPVTGSDAFFIDEPIIAKVSRVLDHQVLLRVGMNEVVQVGFVAQPTDERETGSRRSPPRIQDVWDLRAVLRPVLNIGSVGGGIGGEFGLARRTEHFRFGANLSPISFIGASGEGSVLVAGGYAFAAVDHAIYSAGVGIGADTINDTGSVSEAGSGLSIVQLLRIGAIDGLHVESRVEAVIFRSEVVFGYLQLGGQIAVADSTWLVVRGGGGNIGYGFGEVVVRNLLWGTGQPGSTFLELGLGGAGGFQHSCPETPTVVTPLDIPQCTDTEVGGPMFTAGLEWRL